ncbi:M10 family metallopeptidase C-terminal domain-containing protein, partial [Vibrio clamense]|uniref:M10 family metallopeptidase C-terminal domain-containing protein n=1 Tax=Vibrio clamense TaxID=2910254 RepID=UPI003D24EBB1
GEPLSGAQVTALFGGAGYDVTLADSESVDVVITPKDDSVIEGLESVIGQITAKTDAHVTGSGQASAVIVDNDFAPTASNSHVVGSEDNNYKFKWSDFNVSDQDSTELSVVITSQPASGSLYILEGSTWVALTTSVIDNGYEVTQVAIDAGKLVFVPVADESSSSLADEIGDPLGNHQGDYAEFTYYGTDGVNNSNSSTMSVDIAAVADKPNLLVNSDNVQAAIDFEDAKFSNDWGGVKIDKIDGFGTIGEWHSSNGDRIEVGKESTYRSGGDSTNTVLEIEYNNVNDVVYTDINVEQGQYYSFSFDISGRNNSISNGNSDLNVIWVNRDTGKETILYEFRPTDEEWLRDQTVVLPSDVGGNHSLLLVSADTRTKSSVGAILDNLEIIKADSLGYEDSAIDLPEFGASLNDTDTSETLSVSISGLPVGTQISDGNTTITVGLVNPVDVSALDLSKLSVVIDEPGVYNYSIIATATESSNNDTATNQADLVVTVLERPQAPIIGDADVRLSEEGLTQGLLDSTGLPNGTDTTDVTSVSGSLTLNDQNHDPLTVSFSTPIDSLFVGDEEVSWVLSGDKQTITGTVDHDGDSSTAEVSVVTATIDDNGHYTVELNSAIKHSNTAGEDVESFDIPVVVSDGHLSGSGTISVHVEDDSPVAHTVVHDLQPTVKDGANVQLILDISGSMKWDAETGEKDITSVSRLSVMQDAAKQLLNEYQSLGDTKVQIVTFTSSSDAQNAASGSSWMTVEEAIKLVNDLKAGGGTHYDNAIDAAMGHWDDAGKVDGSPSNLAYFLSDGASNSDGIIDETEQGVWESYLAARDITALAYGMGESVPVEHLNDIAYNGANNSQIEAVVVPDITQLPPVILQSVIDPITGSIASSNSSGVLNGFGADGGHVESIEIDGVTYQFDGTRLTSPSDDVSTKHSFNSDTHILSVFINKSHSMAIDLDTGGYQFFGATVTTDTSLNFEYTLVDNDGDTSTSSLQFNIGVSVVPDVKSEGDVVDHLRLNHFGTSDEELLWSQNPAGKDNFVVEDHSKGLTVDVGAAGDDVFLGRGNDTIYLGESHGLGDSNANSNANIAQANENMKSFMSGSDEQNLQNTPEGEDSALNSSQFSSAHIDIGHGGGGDDTIYGQGGVDLMFGGSGNDTIYGGSGNDGLRGGTGNDTLDGGIGNDILIGGTGNDILTGGEGDDIFKWVDDSLDDHEDVITDFHRDTDHIDLSELISDTGSSDMNDLLSKIDVSTDGDDLTLTISHGSETQTIVLDDAASQFSDYNLEGSSGNYSQSDMLAILKIIHVE